MTLEKVQSISVVHSSPYTLTASDSPSTKNTVLSLLLLFSFFFCSFFYTMPNIRKGNIPKSLRHRRRLAKQQTIHDMQEVVAGCSTSQYSNPISSVSGENIQLHSDDSSSSSDTCYSAEKEMFTFDSNIVNPEVESNASVEEISNITQCSSEKYEQILHENDDATSNSDSDSGYRYSDSDADSIPDYSSDNTEDCSGKDDFHYLFNNSDSAKNKRFVNDIATWALEFQIHQNAAKKLLLILNTHTLLRFSLRVLELYCEHLHQQMS